MTRKEIVMLNKIPCVKETDAGFDKSVLIDIYWPIGKIRGGNIEMIMGKTNEEIFGNGNDGYKIRIAPYEYVEVWLTEGGKTKSIHRREYEYLPPKTRCKTRYYNGRCEKYNKARGWVTA